MVLLAVFPLIEWANLVVYSKKLSPNSEFFSQKSLWIIIVFEHISLMLFHARPLLFSYFCSPNLHHSFYSLDFSNSSIKGSGKISKIFWVRGPRNSSLLRPLHYGGQTSWTQNSRFYIFWLDYVIDVTTRTKIMGFGDFIF